MAEDSPTFDQAGQSAGIQYNTAGDLHLHMTGSRPALFANVPSLPAEPLIGREALLAELVQGLTAGQARALSTDGLGGAGKTALALALAYDPRILAHFTGGVLWASLGPNGDAVSTLNAWAAALGLDVTGLPQPEQRRDRLSQALDDRPVLVVLDDVWSLDTAALLRLARPSVAHLLTTRDAALAARFAGPGNRRHVPPLDPDPAFTLLQSLAPEACAANPTQARQLVHAVGGLPLALVLLGGYLAATGSKHFASQQALALEQAADPATRLALACQRLGSPAGNPAAGSVPLHKVITLSLHGLAEPVRDAFYALGAFAPKPASFDLAAAKAVTGADEAVLGTLIDRNLLEIGDGERLALHQVVADVARTGTADAVLAAHDAYYLGVVKADREDWQRIEREYEQVQHALERLVPDDARVLDWVEALRVFWIRRGLGADQMRWAQQGLAVAEAQGDVKTQAWLLNNIGVVHRQQSEQQQALTCYHRALPLHRQIADKASEATTLNNIGAVYSVLGDPQHALDYFSQALPLRRQVGDVRGEAYTLHSIGAVYADLGDRQQALNYLNQALSLRRQTGDTYGEAVTLGYIGTVYYDLDDKHQALVYYDQALPLYRRVGDRTRERVARWNIAMVCGNHLGDLARAVAELEQVVALDEAIQHPKLARDRVELAAMRARQAESQGQPGSAG